MNKARKYYDVGIIGGGPAGLTAAIYCGRALLSTVLIEESFIGGLVVKTNEIENYPGTGGKIGGFELMERFSRQASELGTEFLMEKVESVLFREAPFKLITESFELCCKTVIIAVGRKPARLNVPGEDRFIDGKGISFCATCDAAFYKDKNVIVVGGGDSALDGALFLSRFAKKVYLAVRRDEGGLRGFQSTQRKVLESSAIEVMWNTEVKAYNGAERLESVLLENNRTGNRAVLPVDGCFLFIGYEPSTAFLPQDIKDERGYIVANESTETSIPGIFTAGDARTKYLHHISTAVGDGATAGVKAEEYIAKHY